MRRRPVRKRYISPVPAKPDQAQSHLRWAYSKLVQAVLPTLRFLASFDPLVVAVVRLVSHHVILVPTPRHHSRTDTVQEKNLSNSH